MFRLRRPSQNQSFLDYCFWLFSRYCAIHIHSLYHSRKRVYFSIIGQNKSLSRPVKICMLRKQKKGKGPRLSRIFREEFELDAFELLIFFLPTIEGKTPFPTIFQCTTKSILAVPSGATGSCNYARLRSPFVHHNFNSIHIFNFKIINK